MKLAKTSATLNQAAMWQDTIQRLRRRGTKFDDRYNEICEDFADGVQEIVKGQVPVRSIPTTCESCEI
jgi:hypothetical protein